MEFGPLRQRILQLAVSGQLVEQLDSEPAVEQVGPAPKPEEVPFEIPAKWKWVQLNGLGVMQTGKTPPTKHQEYFGSDIPFITPGDIDELCHVQYTNRGVTLGAKKVIKTVPAGSVLMVCIGTVGKCGLAAREVAFNQQINAITPNENIVLSNFLLIALASPSFQKQVKLKAKATTIPIVNRTEWGSLWVSIPPLEEQHRIVAKVDDLLERLDQMEAAYSEFAGPMTEHFRNLMLDKAIRGELVPQLDSEPEVEQVGPAPKPEEVPFKLPPKWKWASLGYLVNLVNGDRGPNYPAKSKLSSTNTGLPFVSAGDLANGEISSKSLLYLSAEQCQLLRNGHIRKGDFLLCIRGSLGKFAIAKANGGAIASSLVILRIKSANLLETRYLSCFLNSALFYSEIEQTKNGSCQPNLSAKLLANFLVPLPPIEEQRRIVAKIDELFAGVKQLSSLMEFA